MEIEDDQIAKTDGGEIAQDPEEIAENARDQPNACPLCGSERLEVTRTAKIYTNDVHCLNCDAKFQEHVEVFAITVNGQYIPIQ